MCFSELADTTAMSRESVVSALLHDLPADALVSQRERLIGDAGDVVQQLTAMAPSLAASEHRTAVSGRHASWMSSTRRRLRQDLPRLIREIDQISATCFYNDFYHRNRPLLIRDLSANGGTAWHSSFDDLRRAFGTVEVEVVSTAPTDAVHGTANSLTTTVLLGDFIDDIRGRRASGYYLTPVFDTLSKLRKAFEHFDPLPELTECDWEGGSAVLWMGPKATVTPLHFDSVNVFIVPLIGTKRVVLLPPHDSPFLYKQPRAAISGVDLSAPDLTHFPLFAFARSHSVDVAPGSALFVPVGWWHHVECLDDSLSMTIKRFCEPNVYAVPPD